MRGATATCVSPYKVCRVSAQSPEALPKQAAKQCYPSWSGAQGENVKGQHWGRVSCWRPLPLRGGTLASPAFRRNRRNRAGHVTCKARGDTSGDKGREGKDLTSSSERLQSGSVTTEAGDRAFKDRLKTIRSGEVDQSQLEDVSPRVRASGAPSMDRDDAKSNPWVKTVAGVAALIFLGSVVLGNVLPDAGPGGKQDESAQVQASSEEIRQLQRQAAAFEAVLERSPSDVESLEGAGVIYASLGDYGKAAEYLEKLVKARPNYVEALRLLAEVKFEARDFSRAAYMYRRAIKASPEESLGLLKGLADTLISDNRPNEAVDEILKARARIRTAAATSTGAVRETEEGSAAQEDQGAEGEVDEIPIDLLLAQAYQYWDKPEDALSVYDGLIATHEDDFRAYLAKGVLLKQRNREAEAEQYLEKARRLAPEAGKPLVDTLASST